MRLHRAAEFWAGLALLGALTACTSASTAPAARSMCRNGIDANIYLHLDALDRTLPLDVRACVQNRPCMTGRSDGKNPYSQPGMAFTFTLDDHQQKIDVPVDLTITSAGRQIAAGKVDVPILQDFVTDASTNKTADCGGHGAIAVTRDGKLDVLPLGSN